VITGATHGALEVSSHALALKRVLGIKFAIGVFSNLTPDHLDFHNDMESYYQAKRLLFVPEGENRVDLAAVNIDDPWGERLAGEVPCPVLRYGFRSEANVRALDLRQGTRNSDLRIATPEGELSLRSGLIGRPNAYNILAAVSASIGLRIPLESVRAGIESSQGVPGRMERVDCGQPFTVVVDYAHTPDALEKALETLSQLPHRKIITVFGCGGDRDRKKRPLMGEIASRRSNRVIVTSDNPRTEDPERFLSEIEPGLKSGGGDYSRIADRREAIGVALHEAGEGDVVLIAGKGHETYQVIGTEAFPFDDRSIAREILHELLDYRGARQK
jgi:UDP-N-acetylmuramoyl-L-alanyl-D-glutamate--2,6-diaminopimelate ligase